MWKKSGPLVEKVDLLEARGGSYEPLEPPLRTPMNSRRYDIPQYIGS